MTEETSEHSSTPETEAANDGRWRRWRRRLGRLWGRRHPSPRVRRGAGWGVAALVLLISVLVGSRLEPGLGAAADPVAGVLVGALFAGLMGLAVLLGLALLQGFPRYLGRLGFAALGVLVLLLSVFDFPPPMALGLAFALALLEGVLGGGLAFLFRGGWRTAGVVKRSVAVVLVLAAVAGNLWILAWLADEGSREHLVPGSAEEVAVAPLTAPDPSLPGPHPVLSLTYGSGESRWWPEPGAEPDLVTEPVDASPFVEGNEGWRMKVRHWYWGFDFERFPLNGRVWYPEGEGPFPLALIVHGNHDMAELSDPGYAYLGELLASRGFILVSVDENFFNGSWLGGIDTENDGRGWLLLEHLALWRRWNESPDSPFHGKVDLDRIAVMGHSRGGEAAAIAASFNRLARYPDDATVELPSGFGIRAVVAIAPSDGQYQPADRPTPLADVDYLVLQGGHDADVSVFAGSRQYQRLRFTDGAYHFKAALYAYRANHGQFNTVWGRTDFPWPLSLFLNLEPLMPGEEQRHLGEVYISAFLETSLAGNRAYLPLFRDHRAGAPWLPEDRYISRFEDSTFRPVADFQEDVDVTTGSLPGTVIAGDGLAVWREEELDWRQASRRSSKDNSVVYLGWRGEEARYVLTLPPGMAAEWDLGEDDLLVFSAADSGEEPPEPGAEEGGEEAGGGEDDGEEDDGEKPPLDFTLELESAGGVIVRLPVSRFRSLPLPMESRFTKFSPDTEEGIYGDAWEPTLQTYELPVAAFTAREPAFDPGRLTAVRFLFDRTAEGVLILDGVGFARGEISPPG